MISELSLFTIVFSFLSHNTGTVKRPNHINREKIGSTYFHKELGIQTTSVSHLLLLLLVKKSYTIQIEKKDIIIFNSTFIIWL